MKDFGVVVPIVTPITKKGQPDLEKLQILSQDMIDAGCSGIFVAGSSGRGPWFTRDDRVRMVQAVAAQLQGKSPVLAGCMASGLPGMLENAHSMAAAGADMVVVTVPAYFNYSQAEAEDIFAQFADDSPLPVIVYDIPDLTRMKLDVDLLVRIAHHPNVVGCKDSTADYAHFQGLMAGIQDLPDFILMQGKEGFLAQSLLAGSSGIVVSMVQIDPSLFVALYQAARAGDEALAFRLQTEVNKLVDLFVESFNRRPETSTLFHLLHLALRHRGLDVNLLSRHEGDCPPWLADNARQAWGVCQAARDLY
jgi:dihydrodipicolinate synthase/N-acetylneuraminate lyase